MRLSRVLIAGAAVAAAGIATSAFTASNTVEDSVAGYDEATVSGATTEQVDYVLNADKSLVDEIRFELVGDYTADVANEGLVAWLTVKDEGTNVFAPVQCDFETFAVTHPVSCDIPGTEIDSFDSIALTVSE